MNQILLFIGLVIILCLTIKPVGKKLPFPTLLIFIALGMLLGVNGPAHIDFSDYALTETVCSTALLFIMFYGGFNTNIDRAKPVAAPAVLLSTLGVVITAGITGVFAHFVLGFDWIGGLLLGSVVASTDAASVFSVLREHSLSLKGGTDSLLEVESGSNDPVAYMLTAVLAALAAGGDINIPALLAKQIILGAGLGLAIGWAAGRLIERAHATAEGAQTSSCSPWRSSPTRYQAIWAATAFWPYTWPALCWVRATSPARSRWRTSLTPSPRWPR